MNPENPPAFPVPDLYYPNGQVQFGTDGMSLRDYFAAQVVSAIDQRRMGVAFKGTPDSIAEEAYQLADAMLRARGGTTS